MKKAAAFRLWQGKAVAGLKDSVAADAAIVEGKLFHAQNSAADLKKWVETVI